MSTQCPILTVTLNPALDLSARVDTIVAGPKLRLQDPVLEPGGGGVNIARAIHELGGNVTAWVAAGGAIGQQHLSLLRAQGVEVHAFDAQGDTRQNWAITDATGAQFRLQLPGHTWQVEQGPDAMRDILAQARGLVVLSGSQPPGLSDSFAAELVEMLGEKPLLADISGNALTRLLCTPHPQAMPFMLRLDEAEARTRAGGHLDDIPAVLDHARALMARKVARHVCIAHGAQGSVLAGPAGLALHCCPPKVTVCSKVGAGDSFMGGFALALAQGQDMAQALISGTAAATAAVMTPGTQLCRAEDFAQLRPICELRQLGP